MRLAPGTQTALTRRLFASQPIVSDTKGMAMEDRSQLAEWILDRAADSIIYANRSGAIIRWNRGSTALFGFSAEEAIGQRLDLIIPEHLRAADWRGFEAAMTKARCSFKAVQR